MTIKTDKNTDLGQLIEHLHSLGTTGILETTDGVESYFPYQRRYNAISSIKRYLSTRNEEDSLVLSDVIQMNGWQSKWQESFDIIPITQRISVVPSWKTPPESVEIPLYIKPALAFGTGTHESTQLTLALMENYVKHGSVVLDAGCGSGILTFAAYKLGAGHVDSYETDECAQDNFFENAVLNGLQDSVSFNLRDVTRQKRFHYDLILSNIERQVNLKLLQRVSKSSHCPTIIMSGLLQEDLRYIEKALHPGYSIIDQAKKGEWIALVVKNE